MSATTTVRVFTGSGPTEATWTTNAYYHWADDNSAAASATPIQIPTSGSNYSYRKSLKLRFDAPGPAGTITDLRWFDNASGAVWQTGIVMYAKTASSYTQATITDKTTPVSGLAIYGSDVTALSILPGIVVQSTDNFTGGIFQGAGASVSQPYLVTQLKVDAGTAAGVIGPHSGVYRYDET